MTRAGGYAPREPGSLKDAEAALVKACGGIEKSSALTRVRPSQMHRYTAPDAPDIHMPADVIAALEIHCGEPLVTQFLALQSGGVFLRIPESAAIARSCMRDLADIGRATGNLHGEACEALADGNLTPRERSKVRGAVIKGMAALVVLLSDLGGAT